MQTANDNFYFLLFLGTAGIVLLATIAILVVIVSRTRALKQQRIIQQSALDHQKILVQAIVQSQEKERSYIGSELHDNIVNSMMLLNLLINRDDKAAALQLSAKIVTGIRSLSHELSPASLRIFGLQEALTELTEQLEEANQLKVMLQIDNSFSTTGIPYETTLHLYRIIQELVTNTLKYANARNISIRLQINNNNLNLHYNDDGNGFEYENRHLRSNGMYNIESRLQVLQATFNFFSAPGQGVQMEINVPISQLHKHLSND
jgi:two-component system, NarL family, sensor kinase